MRYLFNSLLLTIFSKFLIHSSIKSFPIVKWFDVYETGSYNPLIKVELKGTYPTNKISQCWDKMMDEYISHFGLTDETIEKIELKRKLIRLIARRIETKNRYLDNEIDMLLIDLKAMEKGKSEKLSKLVSILEKEYKIPFNENMSTYDFFRRINSI